MKILSKIGRFGNISILVCAAVCSAQQDRSALLKAADLKADVTILRSAYESLHPGLYRYHTKAEMDAEFARLSVRLDRDETLQDAFLAFSEFAAKIRCGHTQANPFNQSKELAEALFKSPTRVPFYFEWLGHRMIVTKDFSQTHLFPAGTEIVSIDGVPVERILTSLMNIARADGANDGKRISQLAVTGDSEYETFDIYFPMLFPVHGKRFTFKVRPPGIRRPTHITADALTFEQRIATIKRRQEGRNGGNEALFEAKQLTDGSMYIKMPTWALYNSKWDWKHWLNETLDNAADAHVPSLILDIRGNEGGDDVGDEILSHLIDEPLTLSPMQRLVRYRKVPDGLLPYLYSGTRAFVIGEQPLWTFPSRGPRLLRESATSS